jgi:hypothetical protein
MVKGEIVCVLNWRSEMRTFSSEDFEEKCQWSLNKQALRV